eukprot:TRINITY_DN6212_c0_g1_i1.p1 TRINITY_DN6212_c0_g1~~TRINITY_DN6212_c0_g1_i1.p1  ORF type:complete len:319 (-),score=53.77 TRINITY_DN6212_c0_g1_i1:987-1943(-)
MYPNMFTPAPWTFLIWGALFVGLGVFTAYQAMPMNKHHPLFVNQVGYQFAAFNLLGCVWLFVFQQMWISLSVLVIGGMLGVSWSIYSRIIDEFDKKKESLSKLDWSLVQIPFSALTSWTTIAFTANLFVWMQYMNWESGAWSSTLTNTAIVANAVVALVALLVPDPVYPLVTMWSMAGISWKNSGINSQVSNVALTSALTLGVANMIISTSLWSAGATFLKRMPEFPQSSATEPRPIGKPLRTTAPMRDRAPPPLAEETFVEPEKPPRRKSVTQKIEEFIESAGGELEPMEVPSSVQFSKDKRPIIQDASDTPASMQA